MNIQTVQFHNQEIQVLNYEGKPYVAMRSICENIGLDWASQYRRIKNNKVLSSSVVIMTTENKANFEREVICLPLGYLNGWLLGVDIKRVKPEIKETLYLYQLECYDALYKHFLPTVANEHPNTINVEQQQEVKALVNEVSRKTGKHYQYIYTKMYQTFKVPRYQELKASDYKNVINFLIKMAGGKAEITDKEKHQIFAVSLMKLALKKHLDNDVIYESLQNEVFEIAERLKGIGRAINEVRRNDGIIYDGLAESQIYLMLDKNIYAEATKQAKELSEKLLK
ncbi:phage antirepressor N-terminal domain-containing protein [Ignatzschineria larvae DSM 13226]|uniref:Phage antirepressor N-terminal domain-containing protein n=1 Tax=Ignatzschineria larvae DSM 13226 TaxID=1111732 RepID=A0ABZ3BWZ4_9GAMM|nr:phage antirepressor N-terminal domain-containing protein [Ignatzschineria larvae]